MPFRGAGGQYSHNKGGRGAKLKNSIIKSKKPFINIGLNVSLSLPSKCLVNIIKAPFAMSDFQKYVETPLMKQYYNIKTKHPDAILLFRVGDFYETFGEDAIKAC